MSSTAAATARRKALAVKDAPMLPHKRRGNSKYKPEYCEIVETWGKQGKSRMQIASLLNIDRATLGNWEGHHEEFRQALARAMAHSQAWWEEKAQKSLTRKHFQAQLWRYSMAGRFKEDYAEQRVSAADAFDLASFVGTLAGAAAKQLAAPGDDAKPVEAQRLDDASDNGPSGKSE